MKRILKWSVPINDQPHEIGQGRVVHVGMQQDPAVVQVWTEEWEGMEEKTRTAQIYGTAHPYPESGECVGSVIANDGFFVWHVVMFR